MAEALKAQGCISLYDNAWLLRCYRCHPNDASVLLVTLAPHWRNS